MIVVTEEIMVKGCSSAGSRGMASSKNVWQLKEEIRSCFIKARSDNKDT